MGGRLAVNGAMVSTDRHNCDEQLKVSGRKMKTFNNYSASSIHHSSS